MIPKGYGFVTKTAWRLVFVAGFLGGTGGAHPVAFAAETLSALVPVDEPTPESPLTPLGVSREKPVSTGQYAHLWAGANGEQVIHYYGDFRLELGDRRLSANEAIVWMRPSQWEGTPYYRYNAYLSGTASVIESAGTMTSGPALFVSFNAEQPLKVWVDVHTRESSEQTPLYAEAVRVREEISADQGGTEPGDLSTVDPSQRRRQRAIEARAVIRHRANEETIDTNTGTITAIGEVYVSQGDIDSGEFLEIRADAAVLFLARNRTADDDPDSLPPLPADQTSSAPGVPLSLPADQGDDAQAQAGQAFDIGEGMGTSVIAAYLRGDVVLTQGERMVRADEIYYDFRNSRALMLDAVVRTMAAGRNLPIYVRAEQVRQLSQSEYAARKAVVSTSEFYTPHIHLGAEEIKMTDVTPRDASGNVVGVMAGLYEMRDVTLNAEGVPFFYWPYAKGDFQQSETAIRGLRFAFSDDFGATFEAKWYLFNLLGLEKPQGVDAILRTDYYSKRGPGAGLDVDYELENRYGLIRTYNMHDHGEDNLGPFRESEPEENDRGRFLVRHREILPDNWELTLEASWISDPTFLEEYFNAEFEEGKEQETVVYLKKQENNWALTALGQWRILDFLTQTEHFPDVAFHLIGEPIGDIGSYYNESHIGFARYRPDDRRFFDGDRFFDNTESTDIVFRTETRNEFDAPIKLGFANIVPFVTGRAGYWDASPFAGSLDRMFGTAGVKTGSQIWRLFEDVNSSLLDVNGVRHILKPEATAWASGSTKDSIQLTPFQAGVEDIDDFYGSSLALRQRWQTKRGGPGRWRVVDWITFDVEVNLFGNAPDFVGDIGRFYDSRPENSIARSHIYTDFMYRISDTTAVLSDANVDLNDGSMDLFNVSYAVERTPRFSYFLGYRYIGDTDSNLIGGGVNYKVNTKHTVAVRTFYDLNEGRTAEFDISIIRKFPRWYAAVTFGVDNIEEDFDVGLSVWPEGAPQATLGSRRFTGLAQSTGIRPEE